MKEYTLNDIAQMKESTPQEIIDYLQSKGYAFTKSPDQSLTPSEIKQIDPILFFKLQHEPRTPRPQIQQEAEKKEDNIEVTSTETEAPKGMKLIKACRYFNQQWATIVEFLALSGMPIVEEPTSRLTDEQYDALKKQFGKSRPQKFHFDDILLDSDTNIEYIGIVHFYDDWKNYFGFIGTNDLCPQQTIRFTRDNIKSNSTPTDSSIVSFKYNSKSRIIDAVKTLNRNTQINWKIALRYIGHYADIIGATRSGESRNIHNVLGRLITLTSGYGLWDTLLELVDTLKDSPERKKQFINEYLNHPSVFEVVAQEVAKAYEGTYTAAFALWQEAVAQKHLEQDEVDKFLHLRDLNPNIEIPTRYYHKLRYILFARYGDVSALDGLQDLDTRDANIAEAIQTLPTSEQEARLRLLPNEDFERIVFKHLQGSELHRRLIEERWNDEKANMPYLVFDLESDGTEVTEFAFNTEDNFRSYSGEKQLRVLGRRIADVPIVVGHNIRVWDLPILEKKGFETDAFIWDTLEMEILLNPCRYAYSLHTEHNALADTELTNKLFWNQLYRLSKDKQLCEELKDFLPKETEAIIQALQKPEYEVLFEEEAANDVQFFQELISPEDSLIEALQGINALPEAEQTLLIAPKDLWPRIAQYISLAFPKHDDSIKWQAIDPQLVESNTDLTTFQKCVLRRFIQCSETPIIANIPQYVRSQKKEKKEELIQGLAQIDLSILADCAREPQSHIDCIDIDAFSEEQIIQQDYQHIYIIGSEMQDRTHKCQLGEPYSFSSLIGRSKLPLMMASANYCHVPDAEIVKLGLERPSHTANIWAERMADGRIVLYHNYEYQVYRREFLKHFAVTPEVIDWQFANEQMDKEKIIFVSTEHKSDFDASTYRMTPKTTQRTKYWAYQFALLQRVHNDNSDTPIIYVVNDLDEQDALTRYATSLGFYIPEEGTAFRKLEHIYNHPNGLIIVSKDEFVNTIGEYRTDKSYCYIWDNMDVDRYKLMWRTLPFKDDIEDVEAAEPDERSLGSTAKQCILAEWPIFEHYYSLMSANSRDSKFYILEPSLDEYNDIADLCQCASMTVQPWEGEDAYKQTIEEATEFFDDGQASEFDIHIEEAMEIIKNAFLDEGKDWYPYQREILPHILERKEDCIVSIPTGGGKSVLFQGPAIYRSSYTRKLSLVITPLKALMQDQVEELQDKRGFFNNVDYLSGDRLYAEVQQIYRRIASGEIALLYVTPERFRVRSFIDVL
ncbi:MAG: DEAD/DEAH box helicase [Paludibacteraceae bacterium]|nr:DEAD/DEAH box helicase [Paludibacteraceae bacterium]